MGFQGMSVVGKRKASVKLLGQKMLGTFKHQEGEWWLKQDRGRQLQSEAPPPQAMVATPVVLLVKWEALEQI